MKKFTTMGLFTLRFFTCSLFVLFSFQNLNAQTQGITDSVHKKTGVGYGYYYSLPVDYAANPSKSYPLLISLHGSGEQGNGTTDLPDLFTGDGTTIPDRLNASTFPAYFTVDGETHSFIVVCPQFTTAFALTSFLNYLKGQFRVDTSRVYMTGLSLGGGPTWGNVIIPNRLAAITLVCPSLNAARIALGAAEVDTANGSNLPVWGTYNYNESSSIRGNVNALVDNLNATGQAPMPLAKKSILTPITSAHDAWTKTYDPNYIFDSTNWLNMYQWMLQYTNKKLVAKAGKDTSITLPADSVSLNGSKSTVRQGRIDSVRWSKISGPSTFTITSPTSYNTSVTGLVAGTYQFELKLHHSADTTTATDIVTVTVNADTTAQTQTKVTQNVSTNIKGYLQSLPNTYNDDTTRRFPLLISLHGLEGVGTGSSAGLDTVAMEGIPKLIRDGAFPGSFSVNGKSYSFIVVSPQFNSSAPSNPHTQLNTLLNYLKANLRVDAERIYVAGQGIGGGLGYSFLVGGTTTTNVGFVDSVAAFVGAGSNIPSMNAARWARIVLSNLPQWLTHNNADPVITSTRSSSTVNTYNADPLTPAPLARLTMFSASTQDCWTTTFDPNYILDSALGYNAYEWMLQYTNKTVTANAGHDITVILPDTDTVLDGSKSLARGGRINSYTWSKISGGSVTIAASTSAVTAISGLSAGTYQFELTVTHDSSFIAKDTITVTVTSSSPRVAAPVASVVDQQSQTNEILSAKINPTVAYSQVTVTINGRAMGKAHLQITSMDGKRLQQQSFIKDAPSVTRSANISSLPAGAYIVEVVVGGKHRRVLRFVKQ